MEITLKRHRLEDTEIVSQIKRERESNKEK